MSRYHVNPKTGNPGVCKADKNCPFGGEEKHYGSQDEARQAFERLMASGAGASEAVEDQKVSYDLPRARVEEAIKRVEKANRRAEKAGIPERFAYTVEPFEVRHQGPDGLTVVEERARFKLDRPALQEQGWTFAGTMSWDPESGLITRMVPGQTLDSKPEAEKCDVCKTTRHRNDTYIVKRGDEQLQVGSACLERFMGIKPAGIWMMSFEMDDVEDPFDPESYSFGGARWADQRRDSKELMGLALAVVEKNGWVSRSVARESYGERTATADLVERVLGESPRNEEDRRERLALFARAAELEEEAGAVIATARKLDGNSDYVENVRKLAEADSVSMRNMPTFISAITAHERAAQQAREEEAKAKLPTSSWVGEEDKKLDSPRLVTVESSKTVHSAYGSSQLLTMRDEDGNVYKTFYGGSSEVKAGVQYNLASATVKKHEEWQGNKETMIKLAKFETPRPTSLPPTKLPASSPYAQAWTVEENAKLNTVANRELKKEMKKLAKNKGGWDNGLDRPNDSEVQVEWARRRDEINEEFQTRYEELLGE